MPPVNALRVLGLTQRATKPEIKAAFKALAKEWHPDAHQGVTAKAKAEENFKAIQAAYQLLSTQGAHFVGGAQGSARYRGGAGRRGEGKYGHTGYHSSQQWGEQYGAASKAGYNAFASEMFRSPDAYTNEASARVQSARERTVLICASTFIIGLAAIILTGRRDQAAKDRGDLIDAYYNQATRRWEHATPAMMKDPLLSTLVTLKPPSIVHKPLVGAHQRRHKRAQTLDGQNVDAAYRARQQGTRS